MISNFRDNHLRFALTKALSLIQLRKKVAVTASFSRETALQGLSK
jgi:hypothetical protein